MTAHLSFTTTPAAVANRDRKSAWIGFGLLLAALSAPAVAQDCKGALDGSAACYLTGTYELREEAMTFLHVINPTGHVLIVNAFFFDDDEHPLDCIVTKMSPNDLWEIPVHELGLKGDRRFGVVKIVSFFDGKTSGIGIVGNQRIWFRKPQGVSETGLHPIQGDILKEDFHKMLKPIFEKCRKVPQ